MEAVLVGQASLERSHTVARDVSLYAVARDVGLHTVASAPLVCCAARG